MCGEKAKKEPLLWTLKHIKTVSVKDKYEIVRQTKNIFSSTIP